MRKVLFRILFVVAFSRPVLAASEHPNIILIVADDLGWGDIGCYPKGKEWGEEAEISTPSIDALAAKGVLCTQGYATGMVCAPSRAALMTGKNQQRFGYYGFEDTLAPIPASIKMLPQAMKEAGYRTGMVGKWHVSSDPASLPLTSGFERFYGFLGGQHDYYQANVGEKMHGVGRSADAFIYDQDKPVEPVRYLTAEFTGQAIAFLEQDRGRPFFLYLSYNAPHPPMQAPWEYLEKYAKRRSNGQFTSRDIARAMIENLDGNVGRLCAWLDHNGLRDNTLIIFTSDNGGSDGGPGRVLQHNGGLKGRKSTFYEGGIRVPFILNWPDGLPAGEVYTKPVSQMDLYATLLAVSGAIKVKTHPLDGVNLIPYLTGKDQGTPHQRMFWCVENTTTWAARDGNWKLVREDADPATLGGRYRGDAPRQYKLQLYDLAADPFEANDLIEARPETAARLQKAMEEFRSTLPPSLATPAIIAAWKATLAERAKTPELNEAKSPSGAPGHWKGGEKKARPQSAPVPQL